MEIATLGHNTITVCAKCDQLISVRGADGPSLIDDAVDAHLAANAKCRHYYNSLPTLTETIAELRKIYADRHAVHTCVPAVCACKCGCGLQVKCGDDLSDGLCWSCMLRVMRDDDEHGEGG